MSAATIFGNRTAPSLGYAPSVDTRAILASNLNRLMAYAVGRKGPDLTTPTAIEGATDGAVSKSAIYQAINKKSDLRLTHIEIIAELFRFPAWYLLYPWLDPENPPEILTREIRRELEQLRALRAQVDGWARGSSIDAGAGNGNRDAAPSPDIGAEQGSSAPKRGTTKKKTPKA